MKLTVLLTACLMPGLAACGVSKDLPNARRTMTPSERSLVSELRHADAKRAVDLRSLLATNASTHFREAVQAGEVAVRMEAVDALRAWGEPDASFRPWLITTGRSECWAYEARGLPDIEVWFEDGHVRSVWYKVQGRQPDVPRGESGWLKRWPSREELRESSW